VASHITRSHKRSGLSNATSVLGHKAGGSKEGEGTGGNIGYWGGTLGWAEQGRRSYLFECLVVDETGSVLGHLKLALLNMLAKLPKLALATSMIDGRFYVWRISGERDQ